MLKKAKNNNSEGFTIIEVMIVLAIAALILLIVFLAVPALQRSARNTQRKSDIGRLGSAATTVVSNLNGQTITTTNFTASALTNEAGSLGFYTAGNITAGVLASGGTATNSTTKDTAVVDYNATCNGTGVTYAERSVAIMYATESGSGSSPTCLNE